jgi:predicted KAP-like P-loop ATPase
MAEKYCEENLRFEEFHGIKRENKIMREKIQDAIKNSVLVKTPKILIHWCNWYRLVPKANGDMRLIVINQFIA